MLFKRYKHIEGDKESLYSNDVDCIFQRNKGDIIVVSNGEIQLFNLQSGAFTNLFHSEYLMSVVGDKYDNVWFGSRMGRGLFKLDSEQRIKKFKYFSNESEFPQDISSMFESKTGSVWIGSSGGGLFLFNPVSEKGTFIRFLIFPPLME